MKFIIFYGAYTLILLIIGSIISSQMGAIPQRSAPTSSQLLESIK
jgi:hypothetical protein